MEKIKQKVEHVLGKDHHDTTTTSGTGTHHAGSDPTGPHDNRLANKADPRVDSDRIGGYGNTASTGGGYGQHSGVTGTGHTTHTTGTGLTGGTYGSDPTGPHDSRLANKADPRVDSDRIGGHGNTTGAGGYGTGHNTGLTGNTHGTDTGIGLTGGNAHGTHATTGSGLGGTYGSDPTGPHDTRMANKFDPRVDSDHIGNRGNTTSGGYGTGHSTGLTGGTHGAYGSDPTGPHQSHLANLADPRVDSDRIGGHGNTTGAGGYGTGHNTGNTHTTGTGLTGGSQGAHHSSHLPGPADNTAGPHKSNLMNQMDPRVDSDLDGSKKVGGDRTFG